MKIEICRKCPCHYGSAKKMDDGRWLVMSGCSAIGYACGSSLASGKDELVDAERHRLDSQFLNLASSIANLKDSCNFYAEHIICGE